MGFHLRKVRAKFVDFQTRSDADFSFGSFFPSYYSFGIAGFKLEFAKDQSHCVRSFNITIGRGGMKNGNVSTWVRMQLEDATGHDASSGSYVDVVCLAKDGAYSEAPLLAPTGDEQSLNLQAKQKELPIPFNLDAHAFLSGFRFSWDVGHAKDHQVHKIRTEVDVYRETGEWWIYGEAGISTSDEVTEASRKASSVDARAIGTISSDKSRVIPKLFTATPGKDDLCAFSLDFDVPIAQAECVICDFSVYFKSGTHHIYGSECGAVSDLRINGSIVSGQIICNIRGRTGSTDPDSSVKMLILAVPK